MIAPLPSLTDCRAAVVFNTHPAYMPKRITPFASVLWYLSILHFVSDNPVYAELLRVWHTRRMQHSDPIDLALLTLAVISGRELTYCELLQLECLRLGGAA